MKEGRSPEKFENHCLRYSHRPRALTELWLSLDIVNKYSEDTSESGRSATEVQRDGTDEVLDVDSRRANCCIQLVSKSLIHGQERIGRLTLTVSCALFLVVKQS
ncbi:hypothetical protein T03_2776 [Trichinella britovi]|uniref:Uncharacterized protein n=1 Tax=Trichinella britovi TaxID=45882 RepID=A0A0V1CEX1_TRIBR|nr:hypothetical protein T03_2776 [Trichinella britovi]